MFFFLYLCIILDTNCILRITWDIDLSIKIKCIYRRIFICYKCPCFCCRSVNILDLDESLKKNTCASLVSTFFPIISLTLSLSCSHTHTHTHTVYKMAQGILALIACWVLESAVVWEGMKQSEIQHDLHSTHAPPQVTHSPMPAEAECSFECVEDTDMQCS